MNRSVSINILTFNRKAILRPLLLELKNITYPFLEINLVDNHSQDGTQEMVAKEFPEIRYFRMEKNVGVAARNEGLKRANGDIIITIDDDIFGLNDENIGALLKYFVIHQDVGAMNFKVIDHATGEICNWIHHREVEKYHSKNFLTYEMTEGAVAFQKKALDKSGHYAEYFFLSHEGPDLAFRILEAGYEVRYSDIVTVIHSHAKEGRKSWFRYYYDTRNQFFLAIRNFPVSYSVRYLSRGICSTCFYSLRDGYLRYWFRGIRDGVRGMKTYSADRKVLSVGTMATIKELDKQRPSLWYMIRKRVFRNQMRL